MGGVFGHGRISAVALLCLVRTHQHLPKDEAATVPRPYQLCPPVVVSLLAQASDSMSPVFEGFVVTCGRSVVSWQERFESAD